MPTSVRVQAATGSSLSTELTYNSIILPSNYSAISYGGVINTTASDDLYIYVGGATTQTIIKYLKSDLSYVGESASFGYDIYRIVLDDEYIYACNHSYSLGIHKKYRKSDLSFIGNFPNYGGGIYAINIDELYYYASGVGGRVKKYLKSDLSYVGESASFGTTISSLLIDDTNIYIYNSTNNVVKLLKSNLSLVSTSIDSYGTSILSMAMDDVHIFVGGYSTIGNIFKFLKSDLSKIGEATTVSLNIDNLVLDDVYIYSTYSNILRKYNKSNLISYGTYSLSSLISRGSLSIKNGFVFFNNGASGKQLYRAFVGKIFF